MSKTQQLRDLPAGTAVEVTEMMLFEPGAPLRTTRYHVTGETRVKVRRNRKGEELGRMTEYELRPRRGHSLWRAGDAALNVVE